LIAGAAQNPSSGRKHGADGSIARKEREPTMADLREQRSGSAGDVDPLEDELPAETETAGAGLGGETNPEVLPPSGPLRALFRYLGLFEQAIGTAFIVVILALVLMQVAQRYLPGGGWPWTGEIARLSMVWSTFILSGYLMAHDRHIAIQLVDLVLPSRMLGVVKTMVHVVVGATCVAMAYSTYRLIADDIGQKTAAAEIPLVWVYVIPFIGFCLTGLRAGLAVVVADIPQVLGRAGATQ
jgi:TRAP-type C4-dicarboxylate transport system permease small subunit